MKRDTLNYSKPTIAELFTDKRYKIPKYQRAYSWDKEKAEQFFNDIFSKKDEDYFLGSILLNQKGDIYDVIDGQQRLTTASLFFLATHLTYKDSISATDADRFIHKYLKNGDIAGYYNVLELSRHNDSFYKELVDVESISDINNFNPTGSNKDILDVLKFFIEKISQDKKTDIHLEKIRLGELLRHFTKNVFFLELVVTDNRQASKLFEILNNRGTDLTEADLVRNYILSELERQKLDEPEIIAKWESMESQIDLKNLDKFLRYASFLVSDQEDLYSRIVDFTSKTSSKSVIDQFKIFADRYTVIDDPDTGDELVDYSLLKELNILGTTQVRSVLLAAYMKYGQDDLLALERFLIGFIFKYLIAGKNPNKVEKKYADISFRIYNEGISVSDVKSILNDKDLVPSDIEFENAFIYRDFKSMKLPRYILSKIENHISSEEKIVDSSAVDLEHIMPKNITKWTASDSRYSVFHEKYLNTIGNMVILSKKINSSIKNSTFGTKKDKYDSSFINLIKEIKSKTEWTNTEIEWNARRYFNIAKEIWKLD